MSDHTTTLENTHAAAHASALTHEHGPKRPVRLYTIILTCLLILTGVTVLVAQFDFGEWNVFAAMFIATLKASLVALFFMHLLHDKGMNAIIFCAALFFLGLFLSFDFMDSSTRVVYTPANSAAPAGSDFNRPKNLGVPFGGAKNANPSKEAPSENTK
jgi:cytochrome c oxidase subunit 4